MKYQSPAEIANADRKTGYIVLGVAFGLFVIVGGAVSIVESWQDERATKAFMSSHPECHQPASALLSYLTMNHQDVDSASLTIACQDLATGARSFKVAVQTKQAQQPEPEGSEYLPITLISSGIEHNGFSPDYCVATFDWEGERYTVERQKHIWPFTCDVLGTDRVYFAKWSSTDHSEFSIGALKVSIFEKLPSFPPSYLIRERHLDGVATYAVRRWANK